MKTVTVSWFSAGVSSAIATWLELPRIDRIIGIHINDHQPAKRDLVMAA